MANFPTWTSIYAELQAGELDLTEETFVTEAEAMAYANEAVVEAAALIMGLYEDYFLSAPATLTLVSGQDEIALPTDIYAGKIRGITYVNGTRVYEVKRIRTWHQFLKYRIARLAPTSNDYYRYFLINQTPGAPKIKLTPAAQESGDFMECWYIRTVVPFTTGASKCDIPEFKQFIMDHVKMKVYGKDGHYLLEKAVADKDASKALMLQTLTEMCPDTDNEIQPDFSHYEEHT